MCSQKHEIYWSFWSYGIFKKCPSWYWRRVRNKETFAYQPLKQALVGSAIHLAAENLWADVPFNFGVNVEALQDWRIKWGGLYFRRALLELKDGLVGVTKEWKLEKKTEYDLQLFNVCRYLVESGWWPVPKGVKMDSEITFSAQVTPTLRLGGRIDLCVVDKRQSEIPTVWVIDWKGVTKRSRSYIDKDQIKFYFLGAKSLYGVYPHKGGFYYPLLDSFDFYTYSVEELEDFKHVLEERGRKVNSLKGAVASDEGSCKFCPYTNKCSGPRKTFEQQVEEGEHFGALTFEEFMKGEKDEQSS